MSAHEDPFAREDRWVSSGGGATFAEWCEADDDRATMGAQQRQLQEQFLNQMLSNDARPLGGMQSNRAFLGGLLGG